MITNFIKHEGIHVSFYQSEESFGRHVKFQKVPGVHFHKLTEANPISSNSVQASPNEIFNQGPRDLSLYILSFLNPIELSKCARLSKTFQELSNNSDLWKHLFARFVGVFADLPNDRPHLYKECTRIIFSIFIKAKEEARRATDKKYKKARKLGIDWIWGNLYKQALSDKCRDKITISNIFEKALIARSFFLANSVLDLFESGELIKEQKGDLSRCIWSDLDRFVYGLTQEAEKNRNFSELKELLPNLFKLEERNSEFEWKYHYKTSKPEKEKFTSSFKGSIANCLWKAIRNLDSELVRQIRDLQFLQLADEKHVFTMDFSNCFYIGGKQTEIDIKKAEFLLPLHPENGKILAKKFEEALEKRDFPRAKTLFSLYKDALSSVWPSWDTLFLNAVKKGDTQQMDLLREMKGKDFSPETITEAKKIASKRDHKAMLTHLKAYDKEKCTIS